MSEGGESKTNDTLIKPDFTSQFHRDVRADVFVVGSNTFLNHSLNLMYGMYVSH